MCSSDLFEKAQREISEDEVLDAQEKMKAGKFTLQDFQRTMKMIKKLGSMRDILKMLPGMGNIADAMSQMADPEKDLRRIDGMINSMTPLERERPDKIDRSRRMRIAAGAGVEPHEIGALIKQFDQMAGIMRRMAGLGPLDRMRAMSELTRAGAMNPGAELKAQKQRSKRGPLDPNEAKEAKKKKRKDAAKSRKRNR